MTDRDELIRECRWDLSQQPPIGDQKNRDFFEADASKILSREKPLRERIAELEKRVEEAVNILEKYDKNAGYEHGPFKECDCPSHHAHSSRGSDGCPICTTKWAKEALAILNGKENHAQ